MSVENLPGTAMSPRTLLAQVLDDVEDLETIWVVTEDKNHEFHMSWSCSPQSSTAMAALWMMRCAIRLLEGDPVENVEHLHSEDA